MYVAAFDMDGTLLKGETFDELARARGVEREVAGITARAMGGALDFAQAVRERVRLVGDVPDAELERIAREMPLSPGAQRAVGQLKDRGCYTGIITGGFEPVAAAVARKLGMQFYVGNEFPRGEDYRLRVTGNKDAWLGVAARHFDARVTLAVGDGATDVPMLRAADVGVLYRGKPGIADDIPLRIEGSIDEAVPHFVRGVRERGHQCPRGNYLPKGTLNLGALYRV